MASGRKTAAAFRGDAGKEQCTGQGRRNAVSLWHIRMLACEIRFTSLFFYGKIIEV